MAHARTVQGSTRAKDLARTSLHTHKRGPHPARQAGCCTLPTGSNAWLRAKLQNGVLKRGGRLHKPYINASSPLNLQINYEECANCHT